ncbi:MAG: AI-2E family transporter [Alphaproteobacteria bacterium]|nr:MAG: AI-2E family transporter [Alphaproteobacteria bacterium]
MEGNPRSISISSSCVIGKNRIRAVTFLASLPSFWNSRPPRRVGTDYGGEHPMNEQLRRTEHSVFGIKLTDAQPLSDIPAIWRVGAIVSTLLMGGLALIAALFFGRAVLLPVTAALIVGITLSPATEFGVKYRIPTPVSAIAVVALLMSVIGAVLLLFATPLTEWIARAPEIGAAVQEKVRVFEYPLSVLRDLKNAIMPGAAHGPTVAVESNPAELVGAMLLAVTPAVSQFVVFFGTLIFFLITNIHLRRKLIVAFETRDARLRMLRIWNDIEDNLVDYVALVTMINLALGAVTALMLYLIGFPNPVMFGLLTMGLNYVPYIGPGVVAIVLFAVGLVAMPALAQAALAPALFVAIATLEGHFITPSIVGKRLTLSPFLVFLAVVFWTWLWGPIGAFLAVPLLIVSIVVLGHLWPQEEVNLPG